MKFKKMPIILAFTALFLSILACEGSISTANIADAWMSTDDSGSDRVTAYNQNAIFYAQVDLRNAPDDTTLKAVWTAVNVEGADPNTVITETEFVSGSNMVHFNLTNDGPWPLGTYKVDIYLDNTLTKTLEFAVQ